jgi:hypothetical protein
MPICTVWSENTLSKISSVTLQLQQLNRRGINFKWATTTPSLVVTASCMAAVLGLTRHDGFATSRSPTMWALGV